MGSGRFDARSYAAYSTSTVGKTTEEVYSSRNLHPSLDPRGVKVRESRDSADNPKSTPLIVALDVTGSMKRVLDAMAREGLGTLFTGVIDRKPISDPHVMFMGIGDINCDDAPLQVSQFEADNRIVEQLTKLWLEGGGGGNNFESYDLAWFFGAFHTEHDSIIKRGKRGYLFTVGDEEAPRAPTPAQIQRLTGDIIQGNLSSKQLLELAQRKYDCYHIVVEEGSYASSHTDRVLGSWRELLGQHVIRLADHKKLPETVVSAIEIAEGRDAEDSAKGWGAGGRIVLDAVKHLPRGSGNVPRLPGA